MQADPQKTDAENASDAAVHAAKNAAQTVELARQLQVDNAAEHAATKIAQNMGDIVQDRIEHVLARGTEQDKSIILARVPYICQDIKAINKALTNLVALIQQNRRDREDKEEENEARYDKKYVNQDQFSPVKAIAYGFSGAILTAFMGGLLYLVLHLPK